jgi:hypothetical protein
MAPGLPSDGLPSAAPMFQARRPASVAGYDPDRGVASSRVVIVLSWPAVDDRLMRRNPCRVEGGGREESPERETLSLPAVFEIAGAIRSGTGCWYCWLRSRACAGVS